VKNCHIELKNKVPEERIARKIWAWPPATPGIFGGKKTVKFGAGGGGGVDFFMNFCKKYMYNHLL